MALERKPAGRGADGAGARRGAERFGGRRAGRRPRAATDTRPRRNSNSCRCSSMHTRQGFYADPIYGGNRDRVGWRVIGFPGPASLDGGLYRSLQRAATGSPKARRRNIGRPIVALKAKPARADVCIIGAGASGATAAKVLDRGRHERRRARARALARPRNVRRRRTRQHQPLQSLAGPARSIRAPRARRNTEKAHVELFCPVPQMVGGGTVHWQGWLPRFTPDDFRLRTLAGELKGASLADWPISYDELEPYYVARRMGVRRLRPGGRQQLRGTAQPATIPARRCRSRATRRSFTRAARPWAGIRSRRRRRRCRAPSTAASRPSSAPSPSSTAIPRERARARSTSLFPMR